jgi:phage gp29-like protein
VGSAPLTTSAEALRTLRQNKHNPLPYLKPDMLARVLDQFEHGYLREACLLWEKIAERDDVIASVKPKREKDVSQLDMQVVVAADAGAEGDAHKDVLNSFWKNVRCVNSYDRNERGGFRRLIKQMMTAVSYRYAAHHIIWQPRPDGELRATFEFVPLWQFENRTGRLRYLPSLSAIGGEILADGEWMVTTGDGLMISCCIGYLAKRSAFNDWLIFSEKFSVPGVMGRTTAKKGSPEAEAMKAAVESFGHDWMAVIYGDDGTHAKPIELVQANGNPTGMPMPAVVERVDRKFAALYRGADLSSMSSNQGDGTGASLQEKETDILRRDDAETIAETLEEVSRMVIEWHFGNGVEPLARVELVVPVQEDTSKVITAGVALAEKGARVSISALMERANIPEAKDDADVLGGVKAETLKPEMLKEDLQNAEDPENLTGRLTAALSSDLQPLGEALAGALQAGDFPAMQAALKKISANMPELAGDAENLAEVLVGQFTDAFLGDGAEDVENAARYNPQDKGARGWFIPWNRSRELRGGGHRDQFGPVPSKENPMDIGQQQDRAWRGMEHVMATQGKAPMAVVREDLGEIQFDYGNPSKETGWGLSHLKEKHPDSWHRIPATLVEGKGYYHNKEENKAIIAKGDLMIVIQRKGSKHGWVVTGLEDPKTIGKLTPLKK